MTAEEGTNLYGKLIPMGTFKASTVKEALFNQTTRQSPPLEADKYKKMWKSHIPKKCKFFLWTLSHTSINTMENL